VSDREADADADDGSDAGSDAGVDRGSDAGSGAASSAGVTPNVEVVAFDVRWETGPELEEPADASGSTEAVGAGQVVDTASGVAPPVLERPDVAWGEGISTSARDGVPATVDLTDVADDQTALVSGGVAVDTLEVEAPDHDLETPDTDGDADAGADSDDDPDAHPDADPDADGHQRRPPRLVEAVIGLLFLCVPVLGWCGSQAVLDSETGTDLVVEIGPSDPNYEVVAPTTPTMFVAQVGANRLVGAAMVSQPRPGEVMVTILPRGLEVNGLSGRNITLAGAFAEGRRAQQSNQDGTLGAAASVTQLLEVDFGEIVTFDRRRWEELIAPLGSLEVGNTNFLTNPRAGETFEPGLLDLAPEDVAIYAETIDAAESDVAVLDRQRELWTLWVSALSEAGTDGVPGEGQEGLGAYLTEIAQGATRVEILPGEYRSLPDDEDAPDDSVASTPATTAPANSDSTPTTERVVDPRNSNPDPYMVDEGIATWLAAVIPLPTATTRLPLRLLNGSPQPDRHIELIPRLIATGTQIDSYGNAETFDNAETRVEYHRAEYEPAAQLLAESLGRGKVVEALDESADVAITVVIGADLVEQ
jgi:hypothetical protein